MRPTFYPSLINNACYDPCLFIYFRFENRAFAFDLGDIRALSAKNILKISHIFITHTHMDHFVGFDQFLRLALGRNKTVHLFGPSGFLENIEGKLAGYTWNLAANYQDSLTLQATEVRPARLTSQSYQCRHRFRPEKAPTVHPFTGILMQQAGLTVSAIHLEHATDCLGFRLDERFHVNIKKEGLSALGLNPGAWIKDFKNALLRQTPPETDFVTPTKNGPKTYSLGELADKIALITPGQTLTYIADVSYNPENADKIIRFARGSDHLFIESHFRHQDRDIAHGKHHLTSTQAGNLAGRAGAKRLTTFHYSSRYTGQEHLLEKEARAAYQQALAENKDR